MLEKFVKWQMSRSKCCDFTENLSRTIFDMKNDWKQEWTKILRTDSVYFFYAIFKNLASSSQVWILCII